MQPCTTPVENSAEGLLHASDTSAQPATIAAAPPPTRRPLRALHVIASVDPRSGGPIEAAFSGAEIWSRHGHVREIASLDPASAPWVGAARARTFALGLDGGFYRKLTHWAPWLRYGYSPRLVPWLRVHAKEYDAVIVNGLWNYASLGSWRALRRARTPYYVFTHGMLDPWFNKAYPLKTLFKKIFWRLFEHRVLRDAAGVFYTSEEERRLAQSSFAPYAAREHVVGYGARDLSGDAQKQRETLFAAIPMTRGRRFALFLSRIHEKKGIDLLIEAFARLAAAYPDFDLVIAGPAQVGLQASLMRLAETHGIGSRLHWVGMLSGDVKYGALRAAEFFVLPSHQENFGVVVAEALSCATPVLITNKVNIWREVEADNAGVVVDDTIDGVARGLARMLALGEADHAAMRASARACFAARYDLAKNALDLVELLESENENFRLRHSRP